jgi:hypothetical protein
VLDWSSTPLLEDRLLAVDWTEIDRAVVAMLRYVAGRVVVPVTISRRGKDQLGLLAAALPEYRDDAALEVEVLAVEGNRLRPPQAQVA